MLRYRATYGSELQMDGIVTVFPSIAFICHPLNGCNPVVSGTFGRSRHPQHDPASRRQDGGWRGRVGVPVAAPHTLAATGDLRPPRIRPRRHFHTNGRVRSVALHSRLAGAAALPRAEDGGRVGRAPVFLIGRPASGSTPLFGCHGPRTSVRRFRAEVRSVLLPPTGSGIPGSRGNSERTFLKRHQPGLHGGCAILRPHQQGTRGPISPRPRQRLIFFFLIIIGIPVGARLFLQPNFS